MQLDDRRAGLLALPVAGVPPAVVAGMEHAQVGPRAGDLARQSPSKLVVRIERKGIPRSQARRSLHLVVQGRAAGPGLQGLRHAVVAQGIGEELGGGLQVVVGDGGPFQEAQDRPPQGFVAEGFLLGDVLEQVTPAADHAGREPGADEGNAVAGGDGLAEGVEVGVEVDAMASHGSGQAHRPQQALMRIRREVLLQQVVDDLGAEGRIGECSLELRREPSHPNAPEISSAVAWIGGPVGGLNLPEAIVREVVEREVRSGAGAGRTELEQ